MKKITPFFWFNSQAEEAANYYISIFNGNPNRKAESKILGMNKYSKAGSEASGLPEGTVMTVSLSLEGEEFTFINGGPPPTDMPSFNPVFSSAISFVVNCEIQEEVDWFWEKLSEGGEKGICGWIYKDKFGITWQVVPVILERLINDSDPVKAERAMSAMLKMAKIDIEGLKKAYEGK